MRITIIGGGPGGYVAAIKAAILGAETTVIEKANIGGTCLNWGCIPTKSLLACSEVLQLVLKSGDYGVDIKGDIKPDFKFMMSRKKKIVQQLSEGIELLFKERGVKLINGFGKLIGKDRVEVSKEDGLREIVESDRIILATGSIPIVPPIFPYDGKNVITSDEALKLEKLPRSMIIVGGGVIGCEFGQFFRRLGVDVYIVEMKEHILPFEDEDIVRQLKRAFKKDKIKLFTKEKLEDIHIEDSKVMGKLGNGKTLEAEKILVSIGRKPFIEGLGLEELGVKVEGGKVVVNEKMETNIKGIYAIGDIVDSPFLAHVASKEGTIAVENALGRYSKMSYRAVPRCVYTSPEVGAVGITEKVAKERGLKYRIGKFDFRGLGKAQAIGKFQGFIKVMTDTADKIIGASIVGPHATDLLAELTLAVHLGLTAKEVGDVIHPHPTLCEGLMEALHDVHSECVHSI